MFRLLSSSSLSPSLSSFLLIQGLRMPAARAAGPEMTVRTDPQCREGNILQPGPPARLRNGCRGNEGSPAGPVGHTQPATLPAQSKSELSSSLWQSTLGCKGREQQGTASPSTGPAPTGPGLLVTKTQDTLMNMTVCKVSTDAAIIIVITRIKKSHLLLTGCLALGQVHFGL